MPSSESRNSDNEDASWRPSSESRHSGVEGAPLSSDVEGASRSSGVEVAAGEETPPKGTWTCGECGSFVPYRKHLCTKVGCSGFKWIQRPIRRGDWFCPDCGNHNFRSALECRWNDCPTKLFKDGDWVCPGCGNHNFSSRLVCNSRKCEHRKPAQ